MQEVQHLTGTVEAVTFQNEENGFAVLTLSDEDGNLVCATGPLAGSAPGEELSLEGRFVEHPTYGAQFEATACTYNMPETEPVILKYLSSGIIPGIGSATARRIVDKYGDKSLEILSVSPEKLLSIRGFTPAKVQEASHRFNELFGTREAVAALARLGLTTSEALAVYRIFGPKCIDKVGANPYLLCSAPLYIGFHRADAIAEHLMLEPESRQRVRAALLYTLRHNLQNGHTCVPRASLLATAEDFFAIKLEQLEEELAALDEEGETQTVEYKSKGFVYLAEPLRAEIMSALRIRAMLELPTGFDEEKLQKKILTSISMREAAEGIQYAPLQKEAIIQALLKRVLVITGGPGTGKTTTVNAIIALHEQQADRVLLAAPTGRAAKRLSELTGRKASTLHRLLEANYSAGAQQLTFARNEKNPLRCDVLIIDEMSMVDVYLFDSTLAALKAGTRVILVGDADQLPSVGPGNVLKGVIQSGKVPTVSLREIFRQAASSLIVANAHRIVEGEQPQKGGKEDDFFFIRSYGTACQKLVCDLAATRLPASYNLSSLQDIQVLCPGRKGPLGTENLNVRLQELLNPPDKDKPEISRGGNVFRLGDKVMQIKNNYDIPYTRLDGEPGAGAFNGDIGIIEDVEKNTGTITVLCEDRHVYYSPEFLHELEMAYAITIHKSQGSEFEAVIIPLAEVPKPLQYRNLLYTAVTRARRLCVLAGDETVLEAMVQNGRRNMRFSCFADFLNDEDLV